VLLSAACAGGEGPGQPADAGAGATEGLFAVRAPWSRTITDNALDPESSDVIEDLRASGGWGSGSFQIDFSMEVLRAGADTPARPFVKRPEDFWEPDCDSAPVPLPAGGRLEGESGYACTQDRDCHLIVVQGGRLFEMFRADVAGGAPEGAFRGGCLAVWDLARDYWKPATPPAPYGRGDQCTSADAAGLPIAPLLFTADEVQAGEIKHALRFALPNDRIRKSAYVHPATHSGAGRGLVGSQLGVPYGARLRLRADFDVSTLPSPGAQVVARALQRYGMFLADGGDTPLTAQADTFTSAKWPGLLAPGDLSSLRPADFEMVVAPPRIPLTLDCRRADRGH
jgi:serine/threonine-protein kinase